MSILILNELIQKVRRYTRDTTGSLFTQEDIVDFCNEGIHRLRAIPELRNMATLHNSTDEVNLLPNQYHYFIALYGASRCFTQDEQHYQAEQFMSEFENKVFQLERDIASGVIEIKDANGNAIIDTSRVDYILEEYFEKRDE